MNQLIEEYFNNTNNILTYTIDSEEDHWYLLNHTESEKINSKFSTILSEYFYTVLAKDGFGKYLVMSHNEDIEKLYIFNSENNRVQSCELTLHDLINRSQIFNIKHG